MSEQVTYIREEDLIERQAIAENLMLKELESGSYTIDKPLVKLNPYIISPCAAIVLFKTEQETAVTITTRGKEPAGDITHTFPKAKTHVLPVLGLYIDYDNTVDIRLYQGPEKTIRIKTGPAPGKIAELAYMHTTPEYLRDNLIVVTPPGNRNLTCGFDYNGDIRWYININLQMAIMKLKNGRILMGTPRVFYPPYFSTGLYEMDMVGKIHKEYLIPYGYHHDQQEMPNGDLLVLSQDARKSTVEDVCVLIDRETGAVKKSWDFEKFLTPGEGMSGYGSERDWFHNNSLWYDERTNTISLSGRHLDAMVNIDYDTSKLNWILGDPEGWSEEKQKYCFKPEGDGEFDWQYAQHTVVITPDGDVMCFDNGCFRSKIKENFILYKDNYSRGVRYRINMDDMSIKQVWQYGKELGVDFLSKYISGVEYYGEGHYLVHSGGTQLYDGARSENFYPGDCTDPLLTMESITVELINDVKMLELKLNSNYYRAKKMTLYADGANLCMDDGKKVGSLAASVESDRVPVLKICNEVLPSSCMAHVIEDDELINLKARFEIGTSVKLLLEQGDEVHAYNVSTQGKAEHSGFPYLKDDEKNTSTFVTKQGLSGCYDVRIIIEDKKHETGVKVNC